jgi:cytochrome c biogenesis protein CcdA/thioredoxin-related protein
MNIKLSVVTCITCILLSVSILRVYAGDSLIVSFKYKETRINDKEIQITITALMQPGIKLYALQNKAEDQIYSSITFDSLYHGRINGLPVENGHGILENDTSLNTTVKYFTDSVQWVQNIHAATTDSLLLKGVVNYMYQQKGAYIPALEHFKIFIHPEEKIIAEKNIGEKSLAWIFFTAFAGGLLALLTPCVYSMIPVTVSFFTKRSRNRKEGVRNAVYYSFSIVFIFTLLGFLITLIFGPAALNNLATNWIANLIFFSLFLIFGLSFLGAFEITLPASWSTKADSKAGAQNAAGIFFMALTLVVVSFSCTGPIIGNLLVLAARGNYWGPLTGMFGFSSALALPFALFAFFPGKLNVLGKAGGWLNAVKVTLGFIELALALKFLSNADLSKRWRLLDREVFISLWIAIFGLMGLYLLGKLKLHHDDDLPKNDFGIAYLPLPRLILGISSFAFVMYMIPGLWGAPLKSISAFAPPMGTQDFIFASSGKQAEPEKNALADNSLPAPLKYYDKMKVYEPEVAVKNGLTVYFDYNEALTVARTLNKPVLLDFTGINCVNCRKMESEVWSDPEVIKRLKNDFVIASLYVDAQNIDLAQSEEYYSAVLKKKIDNLGDKNTDLQVSAFETDSQPNYFFIDANKNRLSEKGYGYDPDIKKFISMLDQIKARTPVSTQ